MATLLEDRRQELMDSAPEGVDYVYLERDLFKTSTRMFFFKDGWKEAWIDYECMCRGDIEEIWIQALGNHVANAEELPRRWGKMSIPLEDWIHELDLHEEYHSVLGNKFGFKEGWNTLTPQQLEERPKFLLEFLKSKLGKKPEILKFEHVSNKEETIPSANSERAVCEPACTCANVSWGHEAGCQWKMWKDQHGT